MSQSQKGQYHWASLTPKIKPGSRLVLRKWHWMNFYFLFSTCSWGRPLARSPTRVDKEPHAPLTSGPISLAMIFMNSESPSFLKQRAQTWDPGCKWSWEIAGSQLLLLVSPLPFLQSAKEGKPRASPTSFTAWAYCNKLYFTLFLFPLNRILPGKWRIVRWWRIWCKVLRKLHVKMFITNPGNLEGNTLLRVFSVLRIPGGWPTSHSCTLHREEAEPEAQHRRPLSPV